MAVLTSADIGRLAEAVGTKSEHSVFKASESRVTGDVVEVGRWILSEIRGMSYRYSHVREIATNMKVETGAKNMNTRGAKNLMMLNLNSKSSVK